MQLAAKQPIRKMSVMEILQLQVLFFPIVNTMDPQAMSILTNFSRTGEGKENGWMGIKRKRRGVREKERNRKRKRNTKKADGEGKVSGRVNYSVGRLKPLVLGPWYPSWTYSCVILFASSIKGRLLSTRMNPGPAGGGSDRCGESRAGVYKTRPTHIHQ